jgi:hypothetical protein
LGNQEHFLEFSTISTKQPSGTRKIGLRNSSIRV